MAKRHEVDFLGLAAAILKDVCGYYPTDRLDWDRDLKRLVATYSKRGDHLFLVDLPVIRKQLDAALESGSLVKSSLPLTRSSHSRSPIPRLFRGLWRRIFEEDGCLRTDVDVDALRCLRTLLDAESKYKKEAPKAALYRTVKEFFDVDHTLPPEPHIWGSDGSGITESELGSLVDIEPGSVFAGNDSSSSRRISLLSASQFVADRVVALIGEFIPSEERFRHGPGATAEFPRGGEYKYSFTNWGPRLRHVFPGDVFAIANASVLGRDFEIDGLLRTSEPASRLIDVPKTQKAPRLIAAEPASNQWCQQSIAGFLRRRIRQTTIGRSIDFGRQDLSGELALSASATRAFATIDLKSASDRLSCYVVQRMFRKNIPLLSAMIACRTRYITNNIDKKSPKLYKLRKFASMGSALTFPIQSLCFYIVCVTAGHIAEGISWQKAGRQVRVYGDDLIVPVAWVPLVEELLSLLFLEVNRSKTFVEGFFRESCGTDAYKGYDVTPIRVRQSYDRGKPTSILSIIEASNNFHLGGFWNTASFLVGLVDQYVRKDIPIVDTRSGMFGLRSFTGSYSADCKVRWNRELQRTEIKAFLPTRKKMPRRSEGFPNLLQYFTEEPDKETLSNWESGRFGNPESVYRLGWVPTMNM